MMTTNVPLSRTPAGRGFLLCESGPIYDVSFYLFSRHNWLINWRVGLKYLHTNTFIETPSLEGLPTKAKEDPSSSQPYFEKPYPQSKIFLNIRVVPSSAVFCSDAVLITTLISSVQFFSFFDVLPSAPTIP